MGEFIAFCSELSFCVGGFEWDGEGHWENIRKDAIAIFSCKVWPLESAIFTPWRK